LKKLLRAFTQPDENQEKHKGVYEDMRERAGKMAGTKETAKVNGITEGVIWKQLLSFFFPIVLGTFFQQLYNTTDAVIVGNFVGKEALAAVGGSTGTLINLLVGFFVGLSSGATVIISQYYGARNTENVEKSVHTALALSIVGGAVIMVLGIVFSRWALSAMGTPDDIMDYSVTYMCIYMLGMIPSLIYNMGSGILRAVGDSKRPLYFLIVSCIANIVLDLLFVVVFSLGVAGVGIATVLSQVISAVLVVVALLRTEDSYRLYVRKIRFTSSILRRIVTIGIPAGLQSVMYSVSNIIIQASVNTFGTDTVAVWTAYSKIDGLFWMIMGAFGVSIMTFVGQNFGAQKYDRIQKSVRVCLGMAFGVSIAMSIVLLLTGQYIYLLFTNDSKVIECGVTILKSLVPFYATYVCIEILSGAVRGTGDAVIPMLMTCVGVCVLRVIWIFVAVPQWHTIQMVAYSYPVTWVITSLLFILYYWKSGWLKRRSIAMGFGWNEGKQNPEATDPKA
jgi:putative MATE family efflux protein